MNLPLTPFQRHAAVWKDCDRCTLCHGRSKVVIAKGQVPADVLLVGEAPGISEDVVGKPFVGPAGRLQENIVNDALTPVQERRVEVGKPPLRVCWTNLVGCMPTGEDGEKSTPEHQEIKSCLPRVAELIGIVRPRLIVAVGSLSKDYLPGLLEDLPSALTDGLAFVDVIHPAAILRMPSVQQGIAAQRSVVRIGRAAGELD